MDSNGRLYNDVPEVEVKVRGLIPVRRDLTAKERADRQIQLYSPCGCGSGKKFKFCCSAHARLKKIEAAEKARIELMNQQVLVDG
jgi:hypothetical protein